MLINLITGNSATFEIVDETSYLGKEKEVYINDKLVLKTKLNVFTIYDLLPNTTYNVKVNDETLEFKTLDIKFIKYENNLQETINNLKKGECLVIDKEVYVTNLFLQDNNQIYLTENARLIGDINRLNYTILKENEYLNGLPLGTWEGRADDSFSSIITILGKKDIIIYGKGVIDCNAHNSDFWINHRVKRVARRPKGIFIHTSNNIVIEGITVKNTPSWNQHPFYSKNLKYLNLYLENPKDSPTTDGIDPEACENVLISGCKISVGDDCIAIKSSKIELASIYKTPSTNIVIRNNLMLNGHGGVTFGSELSGGINNVIVSNCRFINTDRGLRIKTQRGRGNLAVIKNVTFKNIIMENVLSGFVINAFYKAGNDELDDRFLRTYQEPSNLTPSLDDFLFEDIKISNLGYGLGYFLGLPESLIKKVHLKNIEISYNYDIIEGSMAMTNISDKYKNIGIYAENLDTLVLENVRYLNKPTKDFILKNVKRVL